MLRVAHTALSASFAAVPRRPMKAPITSQVSARRARLPWSMAGVWASAPLDHQLREGFLLVLEFSDCLVDHLARRRRGGEVVVHLYVALQVGGEAVL